MKEYFLKIAEGGEFDATQAIRAMAKRLALLDMAVGDPVEAEGEPVVAPPASGIKKIKSRNAQVD